MEVARGLIGAYPDGVWFVELAPLSEGDLVAQEVAMLVMILGQGHMRGFFVVGQIALWVATIAALVSAFDYYRRFPTASASSVQGSASRVREP